MRILDVVILRYLRSIRQIYRGLDIVGNIPPFRADVLISSGDGDTTLISYRGDIATGVMGIPMYNAGHPGWIRRKWRDDVARLAILHLASDLGGANCARIALNYIIFGGSCEPLATRPSYISKSGTYIAFDVYDIDICPLMCIARPTYARLCGCL